MQTFLPYKNFAHSARVLDNKRLGKQRIEAYQILNIILKRRAGRGWRRHPAVMMWRGHANALKQYFNACLDEWQSRGHKNTMARETVRGRIVYPDWLGNYSFHAAHRSNLLRKDKKYYAQFGWKERDDLPYVWPAGAKSPKR